MLERKILALFAAISLATAAGCRDESYVELSVADALENWESAVSEQRIQTKIQEKLLANKSEAEAKMHKSESDYDSRFTSYDTSDFKDANVSSAQANAFDKKFDAFDIIILAENGRTAADVKNYAARFNAQNIMYVLCNKERCIDPAIANAYSTHFDAVDILLLQTTKTKDGISDPISPAIANAFDKRFSGVDILLFHDFGIKPEVANKYTSLTTAQIISPENVLGDISEIAKQYDPMFRSYVLVLKAMHLSPKEANTMVAEYKMQLDGKESKEKQRFSKDDIINLIIAGIHYSVAAVYDQRFTAEDIIELKPYDIAGKTANAYNKGFTVDEIIDLDSVYFVDPTTANKKVSYYQRFVRENNKKFGGEINHK